MTLVIRAPMHQGGSHPGSKALRIGSDRPGDPAHQAAVQIIGWRPRGFQESASRSL
jgi:hypothetical protein